MEKKEKNYPLYDTQDSLTSLVSSFELTGAVPAAPGTESETENYAALAGVPVQSKEALERLKDKKKSTNNC